MKTQMNVSPGLISSLLDDVFGNEGLISKSFKATVKNPPVNIIRSKDGYELQLLAPGIQRELINIDLKNNILKVSYEHKEAIAEDVQLLKQEFAIHSFERNFSLDAKMDTEGISATYRNGILSIWIPLKKEAQPKELRIDVK